MRGPAATVIIESPAGHERLRVHSRKYGEITTDQFLTGAKELGPLDWMEAKVPKPIAEPLKTSAWLQAPMKPVFEGPHEKDLIDSDALKFVKAMGITPPSDATRMMFAASDNMESCLRRVTPSTHDLKVQGMLPKFVCKRRHCLHFKSKEGSIYARQNHRGLMTKEQVKFIAKGDAKLEATLIAEIEQSKVSFDAHTFWDPSEANSQYFEADENGQYSGALSRMLPVGDCRVNEWTPADDSEV